MKIAVTPTLLNSSKDLIEEFRGRAKNDSGFMSLLLDSLRMASDAAQKEMDASLEAVLCWPADLDSYCDFLTQFSRWCPRQSKLPGWSNPDTGQSQEVYDRLCHFYFLIDQPVGPNGTMRLQDVDWFGEWLVQFANAWGSFLDTSESFNTEILESFIQDSPEYRIQDSMVNGKPNQPWNTFNEFFSRELNPGLRPIASPLDNRVVTMPADCTYRMHYPISASSTIPQITVKKTHQYASVVELLHGSRFANEFANGTFTHYFLGPYSYHRFHTPVAGNVEECFAVQGATFLEVNLKDGQFDAPDNSGQDPGFGSNSGEGYEFTQARGILTVDTRNSPHGDMGIVAVIPIGMCQVSSVHMTAQPGPAEKGDEFGFFRFGGSDIILLFQEGKAPKIDTCNKYRYFGTDLSLCPNDPK